MMKIQVFLICLTYLLTSCEKNDLEISTELIGQWRWESTCGGIVGCTYPTQTSNQTLKITDSNLEITVNGKITLSSSYEIMNTTTGNNEQSYEIKLADGTLWTVEVSNNHLTTEYAAVIYSTYQRQR